MKKHKTVQIDELSMQKQGLFVFYCDERAKNDDDKAHEVQKISIDVDKLKNYLLIYKLMIM